jgi:hypothetical protein
MDFIMNERSIEEKNRDIKSTGLNLIPFDNRPADIIAAYQEVRLGENPKGAPAGEGRTNIREGIRAEIPGISFVFSSLTERD